MLELALETLPGNLMGFLLGYARPLTFFFFVPFMAGEVVPSQLRISLAFLLSLFVAPLFVDLTPPQAGAELALWLACVIAKELLAGFILAYTAGIIFWAMLSVGFIMDNQRGAGMAQAADPVSGESASLFGAFLHQIALYIFFSSGAFLHMLSFLLASYVACPPGFTLGAESASFVPLFLLGEFARLMIMTVVFSAPIMLICLLSDISLGIINRFAPQLNVFFLSMPIKSALGLFMILLYLGTLLPLVSQELFLIGGRMESFLRGLTL